MTDALYKVCLFGDGGVGKTALVTRYLKGLFDAQYKITVGVEFHTKKLIVDDVNVTLQIWDFAGESQFRFLLPTYIRGCRGGIFMYDVTRPSSLQHIADWFEVVKRSIKTEKDKFPINMIGGKSDLLNDRMLSKEEAEKVAKDYNISYLFECSAKTGVNIEEVFISLARIMLKKSGII